MKKLYALCNSTYCIKRNEKLFFKDSIFIAKTREKKKKKFECEWYVCIVSVIYV